mmetsp:Transcript_8062/g.14506  ORF Transcript_8062/g.14506 Transcript_8062/m.14506 type:complete len:311 (-) Transcript_8062:217-1149(-)|eukprot:CAMPEP_0177769032 /NCGR_PEP_ID=MMETSP0491_2-20121128/10082_1 /TAXON_ID=63592 /ORGANISM="Tetraselmis chuii, Strain PLY429" /LENGTH=310 /DNA_ID=CAMNT_0019285967 /DNA_START=570 /DNA_END=1502 /DNA_ORIENTATION=+
MKISIEVEISPDEVGLATELIATLRALTSHVSVKQAGGNAIGGPVHHLAPGPQVPAPGSGAAPVAPSKGPVSTPAPGVVAPPPMPAAPSMESFRNATPDMFVAVINRLMDVPSLTPEQGQQCIESVAADIKSIFLQSPSSKEALTTAFLQAFTSIVFSVELVQQQQPLLPFMEIIPMLPDTAYQTVRDKLISAVLKHLTIKRPLDADRAEFFAFAEAFAALVKLGTVSISGSITTIITLLNKPENICAAVTMLGKTCELCGDLLVEKCTEQELNQLRGAVDIIATDVNGPFQYDVNYIKEIMGWPNSNGG